MIIGYAAQWGQVKKKTIKDKPKATGRPEGAATGTRGRGRGGSDRGADRGTRGRGGIHKPCDLTDLVEGRGTRGRGRGEARGRGRSSAPAVSDAASTGATIASDETPVAWPDAASIDDARVSETEPKDVNGVNGAKVHNEAHSASTPAWKPSTTPSIEESKPQLKPINGIIAPSKPPISSAPTSRQSRIVDPSSTFSWASIVKPAVPPPAPKPAPPAKIAPPPPEPPAAQSTPLPSTQDKDVIEEPAQTIHDPFTTSEPSKPKVQLPQPALPYIPSLISPLKEQVPPAEPLRSRSLDLLEDQKSPAQEPPVPSVTAHRTSPAPKGDGPPGLGPRFPRASRDNPVIMPSIAPQPLSGIQVQFG